MTPRLIYALAIAMGLAATTSSAKAACGPGKVPAYRDIEAVRYARTDCLGECPSYEVLFTRLGDCYYVGREYVSKHGTFKIACSDATIDNAISALQSHGFYNLQYDTSLTVTDVPHYIVSVERCGVTTMLNWRLYGERRDIPDLFDALDKITNHLSWQKVSSRVESPLSLLASIP